VELREPEERPRVVLTRVYDDHAGSAAGLGLLLTGDTIADPSGVTG
jgi:hypothetical protein